MRLIFILIIVLSSNLFSEECMYLTENGELKVVESKGLIPYKYREVSQCTNTKVKTKSSANSNFKRPQDIKLSGNIRKEKLTNPLGDGVVFLKWQREVEQLFNKSPKRAVIEALNTTARVLNSQGFPDKFRKLNIDWNIIFLGSEISESDIPKRLISACHPGWMRPPADIYIVASRVAEGCGDYKKRLTKDVADAEIAEILLHEIGHVIEYNFHDYKFKRNRFRSEGFATWYEAFSANFSSLIPKGRVVNEHLANAKESYRVSGDNFVFDGTAYDYGRASMYFHVIESKYRVRGLAKVYQRMLNKKLNFLSAVNDVYGFSKKDFDKRVKEYVYSR